MKTKKVICLLKCGIIDQEDFDIIYDEVMKNKKDTKDINFNLARKQLKKEIKIQKKMTSTKPLEKFLKEI